MNKLIVILFVLFCSQVFAEFKLPELETPEQIEKFKIQLLKEGPWLSSYVGAVETITKGSIQLIPFLKNHHTWQILAKQRPAERSQFFIDELYPEKKLILTLKPETKEKWIEEFRQLSSKFGNNLISNASQEANWLAKNDVKAIIVGLINSLPAHMRGDLHKIPSTQAQIEVLAASEYLTDQALQKNFRAQAFELSTHDISKDFLMRFAKESLSRKENFASLLRSTWIQMYGDSQPDPFYADDNAKEEFFRKIAASTKLSEKKITAFLQRYTADFFDELAYEEVLTTENKKIGIIEVTEVTLPLALIRGHLMQDCSAEAYGFACSPNEYAYLIRYNKKPIAFAVATAVKSEDKKVLYLHDFGGHGVTYSIANQVVHAFHSLLPQLGFDLLAISAMNGNIGAWSKVFASSISEDLIPLAYEDENYRRQIQTITDYPYNYDMPEHNRRSHLFRPNKETLKNLQIRFQKIAPDYTFPEIDENSYDSASFLSALKNFNADQSIQADHEIKTVYYQLKNPNRLRLVDYYAQLERLFAEHHIKFSGHFVQENSFLFWDGHLNAIDSTTTEDQKFLNQTAKYMVQSLRLLPQPQVAIHLLSQQLDFFKNNKHFQNYLRSFTGRGANEPAQVERLLSLGIGIEVLNNDPQTLKRLLEIATNDFRTRIEYLLNCENRLTSTNR